jgi:TRAP-type mannitol/chloroaromatic compound transport system permease small subunit
MEHATVKKNPVDNILGFIDKLNDYIGRGVCIQITVSIMIVLYEILSRALLIPQDFTIELSEFVFGTTFVLGGGYALRYGVHVTVDLVWARLSVRKRAILDLVTSILFFVYVGVLIWKGWDAAFLALVHGERTSSAWAPIDWPVRMVIPIGGFLILLQGLAKFTRDIRKVAGKEIAQ